MNTFKVWLSDQLLQKGWTQAELSRRAGISRAAVSLALSENRGVGIDVAQAIASALKLPPEEVYRAAGILPPEKKDDPIIYKIKHLYHTLKDDESRQRALDYLQYLSEQEDKKRQKPTHKK